MTGVRRRDLSASNTDTQSTLEGAAEGAAAGTGAAAATGDLDFEVEEGRPVAFTLEEPLSL